MDKNVNYLNPAMLGLERLHSQTITSQAKTQATRAAANSVPFAQVLQQQIDAGQQLHFSAHASQRIASREIQLGATDVADIQKAVNQAEAKGAKNTLVLSSDYALIVNVPSRTVVTAFGRDQMNQQIVTNIDSTVVIN